MAAQVFHIAEHRGQALLNMVTTWCDAVHNGAQTLRNDYDYTGQKVGDPRAGASFSLLSLLSHIHALRCIVDDISAVGKAEGQVDHLVYAQTISDLFHRAAISFHGAIYAIRSFIEVYDEDEIVSDGTTIEQLLPPPCFNLELKAGWDAKDMN